ncbi:hypothetical protein BDK51DRAFT_31158 [Blyttiomyces helicus]|uniref:Uncharacterized protein n=1 Tax=Blyttiomyces helicus TaxID=388810 RepID=A0A4P9WJ13_9FUNG|nr:hypothetical protein BDK51DRAFT_31158 [Blyttiomyces helicus]|eukprot:RKO92899.1 hypothetical protein BDK51DRAFT_31158 [Blyttiomyces helicus]
MINSKVHSERKVWGEEERKSLNEGGGEEQRKVDHFADDDDVGEWDIGNGFANGLATTEETANFGESGRHVGFGWLESNWWRGADSACYGTHNRLGGDFETRPAVHVKKRPMRLPWDGCHGQNLFRFVDRR